MAGYRKKKKPHQKEKPLFGKDFVCFFALVKETVKACGPYKFVIIDKAGKEIPVHLTKTGDTWIDGKKLIDADAREFIAKNPGDFERLFLEANLKLNALVWMGDFIWMKCQLQKMKRLNMLKLIMADSLSE